MKLSQPDADVFVPDGAPVDRALARTTHLAVGAHQDDLEIMAYHGIAECHGRSDRWFTGVVVTDGAGSPRNGPYAALPDAQMCRVRREEQRRAASIGGYSAVVQLAHPSAVARDRSFAVVVDDLRAILMSMRPQVAYLHNPADKHDTHVAVLMRSIEALRSLPQDRRPARVLGCEVWRDLDWLPDHLKVALDTGGNPELALELLRAFDSQVGGGKRYDLATQGRRLANATFHNSHATDRMAGITWAVDLAPLLAPDGPAPEDFTLGLADALRADIHARLNRVG